jgi:glycine/D-amino acid oxidase-like deaminating enzyme
MRVIVIGAGVIGLLTAMECVRAGADVDLVDRTDIPSAAATSHDPLRVVRALHRDDAALTRAATRLDEAWSVVEHRLGVACYHHTGVLTAMPARDVDRHVAWLAAAGQPAAALSAADLNARYQSIRFGVGDGAVFEPDAGCVRADLALSTLACWLRDRPEARLHPHRTVVGIDGTGVARLADGGVLTGDSVVIAAGPWSRDLLPASLSRQLTLKRQTMLSYSTTDPAWSALPAVLGLGQARDTWLMPPVAGAAAQLSAASVCRTVTQMTDRDAPDRWREHLTTRFRDLLTGFDPAAVTAAADGYYLTDDTSDGPMLAQLHHHTWAYAACGGMSFKFAPLVADALADRALGRPPRTTGLPTVDQPRRLPAASTPRAKETR